MVRRRDPPHEGLTPQLDDYRPMALRANNLIAKRDRTPAETQELIGLISTMAPIIERWSDPASLGYQAQVHDTWMLRPDDWPSHQGQQVLWTECAHGNWFFLPWHRAYLLEYEAVVRAHIEALGGPHETWGLPYWNSSDYLADPDAALLPGPLADPFVPDDVDVPGLVAAPGEPRANPLHEPSRVGPSRWSGHPRPSTGRTRRPPCARATTPTPRRQLRVVRGRLPGGPDPFHSSRSSARWTDSHTVRATSRPVA